MRYNIRVLREMIHVRQIEGEPRRRWFLGDTIDLTVWVSEAGGVVGFQLLYQDGHASRKALSWKLGKGYAHENLDEGETEPLQFDMSPMLTQDGILMKDRLLISFLNESAAIDKNIAEAVASLIRNYP